MKQIELYWRGPYKVHFDECTSKYTLNSIDGQEGKILSSYGVYQIYGNHPVYGRDSLLYIGQVSPSESGNRDFKRRITEHLTSKFWYENELSVYFAAFDEQDVTCLLSVESLLISVHKPSMNSEYLYRPVLEAKQIHILNFDFRGDLVPECSGRWFDFSNVVIKEM